MIPGAPDSGGTVIAEMVGGPQDGYTLRLPGDKPLPQIRVPIPVSPLDLYLYDEAKIRYLQIAEYVFERATETKWYYMFRCQVPA